MTTYKRIVISGHGGTEVLRTVEEVLPEAKPGQVRVRVLAAGVGYADVMAQRGGYPLAPRIPFTPGYDFAGIVDQLGPGATGVDKGQHVAALNPEFGSYAEYVFVRPEILVPFPATLDPGEVVSLRIGVENRGQVSRLRIGVRSQHQTNRLTPDLGCTSFAGLYALRRLGGKRSHLIITTIGLMRDGEIRFTFKLVPEPSPAAGPLLL